MVRDGGQANVDFLSKKHSDFLDFVVQIDVLD